MKLATSTRDIIAYIWYIRIILCVLLSLFLVSYYNWNHCNCNHCVVTYASTASTQIWTCFDFTGKGLKHIIDLFHVQIAMDYLKTTVSLGWICHLMRYTAWVSVQNGPLFHWLYVGLGEAEFILTFCTMHLVSYIFTIYFFRVTPNGLFVHSPKIIS